MAERKEGPLSIAVNSLETKPKCCAPEAMKAEAGSLPLSQSNRNPESRTELPTHPFGDEPERNSPSARTAREPEAEALARMVLLSGGAFLMGAEDPEGFPADGEGPVREVTLSPFWIDRYPVTNATFARFIHETGYQTEAERFGWSFVFWLHIGKKRRAELVEDTVVGAPWWLAALLVLILLAAAVEDAVRFRISNITCLGVCCCAIVAMALNGFPLALWQNLVVFALVLTIGTAAFAAGWLGGGDVKLFAATCLWLKPETLISYSVYAGLIGMALALALVLWRKMPLPAMLSSQDWMVRLHSPKEGVPYGIALAAAGLLVYPQSPFMAALGV